jgi:glycosyltransferase involved in cell wall biosynthesis
MIAGDGEFREACERLTEKLGIENTFFLGKVPLEKAAAYYKTCDVFVLPSCRLAVLPSCRLALEVKAKGGV